MHGKGSSCSFKCHSKKSPFAKRVRIVNSFITPPPFIIFQCITTELSNCSLLLISDFLKYFILCSVFNHLLDDCPLPANEASSSILVATFSHISSQQGKGATVGGKLASSCEVEKGLLMLISSDAPGLQV